MASRKTYLYGLGTGLIAGALLLQLASIGESASRVMTYEELQAAATARGYVLHDANTTWYTAEELETKVAEAEARARAEEGRDANPADNSVDSGTETGGMVYAFTIAAGTELATVAKLLYELGLVSDYNGFLLEMEQRELTGKVQAKHYRFDEVPTMEELIEELTTP